MIEQHYLEHRYYFQQHYWNSDFFLLKMLTMVPHRVVNFLVELIEDYKTKAEI